MDQLFNRKDCISHLLEIESYPIFVNSDCKCKYTIAIPTYNRIHDLRQSIESAIRQDYSLRYNILVVDNNPERNDDTEKMMYEYYRGISNITYYKNSVNIGMINNWNKLFLLSETKYVIMLHDDDILCHHFLTSIDGVINKMNGITALNAGKLFWDGNESQPLDLCTNIKAIRLYQYSKYSNFPFFHFGAPSGCVFDRLSVIEEGGFDNDAYPSSDYVFIQKLSLDGKIVLKTKEPLMLYRVGSNTSSKVETSIAWIDAEKHIKEQLGGILHLPKMWIKLVTYFEIKLLVRGVCKTIPSFKYEKFTDGGFLFLVVYNIYRIICEKCIRVKRILL